MTLQPPLRSLCWLILLAYVTIFVAGVRVAWLAITFGGVHAHWRPLRLSLHALCTVYTVELVLSLVGYCAMSGGWTVRELCIHHGFFTLAVIWTLNGDAADRWSPALAVSLLTAANEASLVAHVLGAPDRIAALRRLYGFSIIAALCATEAWCYADAITAAPRLVSTHVPLFAILYHLHLLRMYVRRWARTRTL